MAAYEVLALAGGVARLDEPTPVLPIHRPYCVAVPAVHWNVTDDEANVEPLAGLVIVGEVEMAVKAV